MSEKTLHKVEKLKEWGFKLTQDGGEVYYQRVLDFSNYFDSPFLYSTKVDKTLHSVYLWGKEESLTEQEIVEILDDYKL